MRLLTYATYNSYSIDWKKVNVTELAHSKAEKDYFKKNFFNLPFVKPQIVRKSQDGEIGELFDSNAKYFFFSHTML